MKLKVIAGAKEGLEVPLKKSKFVIGRSADCTLRAGSDAISRHHCALLKSDSGKVIARDLGSRNGTLVNGVKISKETPIKDGDELQVGPLRFLVISEADLKRDKKPPVKSVAEAVDRASQAETLSSDDDISRWLLGSDPVTTPSSMRETQTLRMDETQVVPRPDGIMVGDEDGRENEPEDGDATGEQTIAVEDLPPEEEDQNEKKGRQKPGKLPPLPAKPQAKDSREAAADILREMARRR